MAYTLSRDLSANSRVLCSIAQGMRVDGITDDLKDFRRQQHHLVVIPLHTTLVWIWHVSMFETRCQFLCMVILHSPST